MIEIGRDSGLSLATRRIAGTLTGVSAILALIWILRGPLGIQQYSLSLLLAGFSLGFLGRVFRTETISGAGSACHLPLEPRGRICRGHTGDLDPWLGGISAVRCVSIHHFKLDSQSCGCGDRCWSRSVRGAEAWLGAEVESDSLHRRRGQGADNGRNQTRRETRHGGDADQARGTDHRVRTDG